MGHIVYNTIHFALLYTMFELFFKGLSFSLEGGSQIYKESQEIATPYFGNKNFMTPHHRYTLPPKQAKIVLKSVFLNKINTLSVVILWLTTFWSSKMLWPPLFFFPKIYDPPVYLGPPLPKKMIAPNCSSGVLFRSLFWIFCLNQKYFQT